MKKTNRLIGILLLALALVSFIETKKTPHILVYARTKGFHHKSIAAGLVAIQKLGLENNFAVDTTTDSSYFIPKTLKKYAAVVFLSTTGNVLNDEQQAAFEQYIRSGHGFVGVHAATDTEYDWPWYNQLVGAYFQSHPKQQEAMLQVVNDSHISTQHLPRSWKRFDEWYNFKSIQPGLNTLITIDEKSYTGGTNGDVHPMAWYHDFDGGRSFYTALGHTDESFSDTLFLKHLLGGILYAVNP
ncbi:MAG: ThuA domain-containing protein [Bacteroidetes bacterium]|nr:ThuA domain-containing protein [Bacteroidota bacterium]